MIPQAETISGSLQEYIPQELFSISPSLQHSVPICDVQEYREYDVGKCHFIGSILIDHGRVCILVLHLERDAVCAFLERTELDSITRTTVSDKQSANQW